MSTAKANGLPSIPATSRKMVQSLKEIVNCPEQEIYAMLKECSMDPNDAVNRLLSQDTFHEVRSKREKKELKEGMESRSQGSNGFSSRGSRNASGRNAGHTGSTHSSTFESGVIRGKAATKKENGSSTISSSSAPFSKVGNHSNRNFPASLSESIPVQAAVQAGGSEDVISFPSQPSSSFQSAWLGPAGHFSMADIVKMGGPHGRGSYHELHSSHVPMSKVSETLSEPIVGVNQHGFQHECISAEQSPVVTGPPILELSINSTIYSDPSPVSHVDGDNMNLTKGSNELRLVEGHVVSKEMGADCIGCASSDRQMRMESSARASRFDDSAFDNGSSQQHESLSFEHQEGLGSDPRLPVTDPSVTSSSGNINIAVSSVATSLQHLSLSKEELGALSRENNLAVIIPNHLQVQTAECSHLSFGSFVAGLSAPIFGSFSSKSSKNNLDDASFAAAFSSTNADVSLKHIDTRNADSDANESKITSSNGLVNSPPSSQPEIVKHDDTLEAAQGRHYSFPSTSDYSFESTEQTNVTSFSNAQTHTQMQNVALSSLMNPYPNSSPTNLVPPSLQPSRESDIPYLPFLAMQSLPTKQGTTSSSFAGPATSLPEALKLSFSPQPVSQSLPGASIPTGPAAPQHLPVHPFSQPTLPVGHFASIYPLLPPSYTYLPSAFQQAYSGNSAFHQSSEAVHGGMKYSLPQYKNSLSVSGLPQSATTSSVYSGFGSSLNIPGNFTLNPLTRSSSTTVGYEDMVSSQYKESNHYGHLQENQPSGAWVHGPGSRNVSDLPASTFFGLHGQNQSSGYRQGQHLPHYGTLGYPTFYHSQTAVSRQHQQPTSNGSFSVSQGPQSQPSHQIWQHNY